MDGLFVDESTSSFILIALSVQNTQEGAKVERYSFVEYAMS